MVCRRTWPLPTDSLSVIFGHGCSGFGTLVHPRFVMATEEGVVMMKTTFSLKVSLFVGRCFFLVFVSCFFREVKR